MSHTLGTVNYHVKKISLRQAIAIDHSTVALTAISCTRMAFQNCYFCCVELCHPF